MIPDRDAADQTKQRTIAGVAYWFPHQGSVTVALLFDVDRLTYHAFAPARANERRIALHSVVSF